MKLQKNTQVMDENCPGYSQTVISEGGHNTPVITACGGETGDTNCCLGPYWWEKDERSCQEVE